jgi:hypothetical protein
LKAGVDKGPSALLGQPGIWIFLNARSAGVDKEGDFHETFV